MLILSVNYCSHVETKDGEVLLFYLRFHQSRPRGNELVLWDVALVRPVYGSGANPGSWRIWYLNICNGNSDSGGPPRLRIRRANQMVHLCVQTWVRQSSDRPWSSVGCCARNCYFFIRLWENNQRFYRTDIFLVIIPILLP